MIPDERVLNGESGLTKTERLQLVNHAPSTVVELHTVRKMHRKVNVSWSKS